MAIHMFTIAIFFIAFIQGVKAGFVGALIGSAVGMGVAFVFYSGIPILIKRLPRRLGFAGWILPLMWLILCISCACWLPNLLLTVVE